MAYSVILRCMLFWVPKPDETITSEIHYLILLVMWLNDLVIAAYSCFLLRAVYGHVSLSAVPLPIRLLNDVLIKRVSQSQSESL